jgi:hypothetical protein
MRLTSETDTHEVHAASPDCGSMATAAAFLTVHPPSIFSLAIDMHASKL